MKTVIIIIIMEASLFRFSEETQQKKLFSTSCFILRVRQGLSNSCSKMSVRLQNLNGKEDVLIYMDDMCSQHSTPSFVHILDTFQPTLFVQKSFKSEREFSRLREFQTAVSKVWLNEVLKDEESSAQTMKRIHPDQTQALHVNCR